MNIVNLCLVCRKNWTSNLNGCCNKCIKKFGISEVPKITIHKGSENVKHKEKSE